MENQQAQPSGESTISLSDLQNVLVVMDLASSRGAFRGNELEPVGTLYNKIKRFIDAATPAQPAGDPATGESNG